VIIDPVLGVCKGDIGVRNGTIVGVGKAGNPDTMDGVDMVIGQSTDTIPADGLIATPGALDIHVHFNSPQLVDHALASGVTTMLGAGSAAVRPPVRPARGTSSGSCRPPRTGPSTSASTRRATAVDRNRCASRSRRAPAG